MKDWPTEPTFADGSPNPMHDRRPEIDSEAWIKAQIAAGKVPQETDRR